MKSSPTIPRMDLPPSDGGVTLVRYRIGASAGFSLIELLVATAVMAMLLVVTLQILTQTSSAVKVADRHRDTDAQIRTAMDRLETDFATAMLGGGSSALVRSANEPNSFLRFICLSRAREGSVSTQPRGAVVGYGVNDVQQTLGGRTFTAGLLRRGDGRISFDSQLALVFNGLSQSPPTAVIPDANWEAIAGGIVRFHISYLLDNGDIVQTPPAYSMVSAQTFNPAGFLNDATLAPDWQAVAFAPENAPRSSTPPKPTDPPPLAGRYVKALIVSMACASPEVLALASDAGKLTELGQLGTPVGGQTALATWEQNLSQVTFPPLLQNIRFYQRTLAVP